MVSVTHHGMERLEARANVHSKREIEDLFKKAIKFGKSPADFSDDVDFSIYLKKKLRNGVRIKVYNGLLFLYKNKMLITAFEVPPRFQQHSEKSKGRKSNKVLLAEFIHELSMLISMVQLSISINLLQDEETTQQVVRKWKFSYDSVYDFIYRVTYDNKKLEDYSPNVVIEESTVVQISQEILQQFTLHTENMVGFGKKKQDKTHYQMSEDIDTLLQMLSNIKYILDFIKDNNYFLVQNQ